MKRIIILILIAIVFYSCEEQDNTYQGPTLVEFAKSFNGSDGLYLVTNSGQTFTDTIRVQLVGPQQSSGVSVTWEIDTDNTTAIEGIHYNMISASTIEIPASSSYGYIIFQVLGDGFPSPDEQFDLSLDITSSSVGISENYKSVVHEMAITCPSNIPEGTYLETGAGGLEVQLTALGDGMYTLSQMNFRYYSPSYADIPGTFTDVCNQLVLEGVPVPEAYGIAWIGDGVYDPGTGTLTFTVADATYNQDYTVDMEFVKQ